MIATKAQAIKETRAGIRDYIMERCWRGEMEFYAERTFKCEKRLSRLRRSVRRRGLLGWFRDGNRLKEE